MNNFRSIKNTDFNPYDKNGGTTVAIAGLNFCVISSDTRLVSTYEGRQELLTRDQPKLFRLTERTVLGSTGCWCDTLSLSRLVKAQLQIYSLEYNSTMSTQAAAQMLSIVMYNKRFAPYMVSCILTGLDKQGCGAVYSFDSYGYCERHGYRCLGASGHMMQSFLDNQLTASNRENVVASSPTLEQAVILVKDAFISAAERDIFTGDSVYINIITKDGIQEDSFPLRKD